MDLIKKKELLAELIQLNLKLGYGITHLIGVDISKFSFERIKKLIEEKSEELVNN